MSLSPFVPGPNEGNLMVHAPAITATATPVCYGYQATAADLENPLAEYWRILLKRKWIVLACLVIVSTLAAIATFRMTPLYESTARVAIYPENTEYMGFKDMASTNSTEDWDYTVELDTQIGMIESDSLAAQVIRKLQLDRNPFFAEAPKPSSRPPAAVPDSAIDPQLMGAFHSHLTVNKVAHTRIVEIRYLSPDPKLSAEIVNTLANAYMEYNFKTKYDATLQTSEWLGKQLADLRLKVETSQEALVDYQRKNGILGIDEKQNIVTAKLDELNRDLTQAEADRIQKQARYQQLTQKGQVVASDVRDPVLDGLRQRRSELANRKAELGVEFGPAHPKIRQVDDQLRSIDTAIEAQERNFISAAEMEYKTALNREVMLRGALDQQKKLQNDLNQNAVEYNLLKRDADTSRQLYDGLMQKMKEAGISAGLKSGNIRVIDIGRVARWPSKPNRRLNLVLGLWAGLFGGVVLAFVLERVDNTVRNPDDVQAIIGLPLLGNIPRHLNRTKPPATARPLTSGMPEVATVTALQPQSAFSEAYRALRTSILLSTSGRSPQVILFTSGLPKEGKTTTSVNSAIVLAQRDSRVLLVDADMRRPSIHRKLRVPNTSGLSTALSGSATAEQCILTSAIPNLFVLPAGPPPPNPAELLSSKLMTEYIAQWRKQYDHIVIDTPPILNVTDAALLSVLVDGVVLVIRSGETTKPSLRHSRELLGHVGARVIGCVVNALDERSHNAYYYYYAYGRKYYSGEGQEKA